MLILTYWSFEDALIQSYTLPYLKIIRQHLSSDKKIWFQTLQKKHFKENNHSVRADLFKSGIIWIPCRYINFGYYALFSNIWQLIRLLLLCYANRVKVIHVWCMPAGIIGYFLSFLTGAELIIDSYEPHAESMVENGSWKYNGVKFRILFLFERLMSHQAKVIISATHGMKFYAKSRYGVSFDNFYVKPACVDLALFDIRKSRNIRLAKQLAINGKTILVYAGKFGGIYLEIEVFEFAKVVYDFYGDMFRFLVLTSHAREEIEAFCTKVGLPSAIVVSKFVSYPEIPDYIGLADFAITPVKPVPSKLYCTPIKDGEYWAMGLPIVITKGISDDTSIIADERIGVVLETLDAKGYSAALCHLNNILASDRQQLSQKIRDVAIKYRSFAIADDIYSKIYY